MESSKAGDSAGQDRISSEITTGAQSYWEDKSLKQQAVEKLDKATSCMRSAVNGIQSDQVVEQNWLGKPFKWVRKFGQRQDSLRF